MTEMGQLIAEMELVEGLCGYSDRWVEEYWLDEWYVHFSNRRYGDADYR